MPDAAPCSITPDSKLGDLLARWPALEAALVELSPHFRALQNPVLRRTVAKVATLRQVSKVSGVALGTLISTLRTAVGQGPMQGDGTAACAAGVDDGGHAASDEPRPAWAAPERVTRTHDARAEIEAGEHPLPRVMSDLGALPEGEVYELVTPFVPAPLVDVAAGKGYVAWSASDPDGTVRTYFRRK